jgi:hypothetical protein
VHRKSARERPYEDVAVGVALGVPLIGVPPCPLSIESVGVAVGLPVPVPVGVGDVVVGVAVGLPEPVPVGVGDVVVGVGVGDVVVGVGVADTVGDGLGLAGGEVAPAQDGDGDGDGAGDGGADGVSSSAVFGAAEVAEPAASALGWTSWLVQAANRDGGQSAEGAGLADAASLDAIAPRPGAVP